jgi:hypothetical protein
MSGTKLPYKGTNRTPAVEEKETFRVYYSVKGWFDVKADSEDEAEQLAQDISLNELDWDEEVYSTKRSDVYGEEKK